MSCLRETTSITQIGEIIASGDDKTFFIKPDNVIAFACAQNNDMYLKTYTLASMSGRMKTHAVWGFFQMHPENND